MKMKLLYTSTAAQVILLGRTTHGSGGGVRKLCEAQTLSKMREVPGLGFRVNEAHPVPLRCTWNSCTSGVAYVTYVCRNVAA